ncbi:flagellar basal body P-ring protein FlgI [Hankyongella ginsenosidimutans]|uniref:flagellar basal body P-ring protein FlgI n=1 Tax=Hankyongella ginsenosidimutans TaxID=1763828 RepID=UPI001FE7B622|nr:flagellar basal body P-ring protein FlgI [Hankyongella ginsenosidimutans]
MPQTSAVAASRIKDIVDFENVRENQLVGYGLVVGLKGTGDSVRKAPFTEASLKAMLERLGVNVRDVNIDPDNVAAVSVTATLPPFARKGSHIDVQISAIGDAENLQGGTLLVTPLVGLDGEVYAVAQGSVAVSGFEARGAGQSVSRGVTTAARIAGGGIVEREVAFNFNGQQGVKLALKNPDFTTARRIAAAINEAKGGAIATALDPTTVQVIRPVEDQAGMVALLGDIEQLPIKVDQPARVVVDEASGTIVMGADVKISEVAIAQGNLTIRITETPQVSQPNALSQTGQTQVVPRTSIDVDEGKGNKLALLRSGVSLRELVDGLNALGVGPRDLITILLALKTAGALQAEVEVF